MKPFQLEIEVTDIVTGERVTVRVNVVRVGNNMVTEIQCPGPVTAEQEEAIEYAIEDEVRRQGLKVQRAGSEHFTDREKLKARMRRHLGGGQG